MGRDLATSARDTVPRRRLDRAVALAALLCAAGPVLPACGNPVPGHDGSSGSGTQRTHAAPAAEPGELVAPPFRVQGDLNGLLMVWFDDKGLHTAQHRSDIPEPARAAVRVESLSVPPGQRLDPDHVYVADVRKPGQDGSYPVFKHTRAWFDAQVDRARPAPKADDGALVDAGVTIYKASWCGVCRSAAAYLRSRHVPFVEKDIEKDPAANREMLQKAHAAGASPRGVPVIDFHGHLLMGFDREAIDRLIDQYQAG